MDLRFMKKFKPMPWWLCPLPYIDNSGFFLHSHICKNYHAHFEIFFFAERLNFFAKLSRGQKSPGAILRFLAEGAKECSRTSSPGQ